MLVNASAVKYKGWTEYFSQEKKRNNHREGKWDLGRRGGKIKGSRLNRHSIERKRLLCVPTADLAVAG